jgi:heme exporter protein B
MFKETLAVFKKDILLEWKTRFGINSVIAFVFSSLLLVIFSLRAQQLTPTSRSGLLWVIIVFAALSSLSRSFVSETERKTFDYLRLYARATPVYLGKLLFNYGFTLLISLVSLIAYVILLDVSIASWLITILAIILGSLGLASVSTLLAGIIAQADRKGSIFSVISMPLMIPLLLLIVRLSKAGFTDGFLPGVYGDLTGITAFCGVMTTLSILLFDFIWDE